MSLRDERPAGASAESLKDAATRLCAGRKLVLLISDFRWPTRLVQGVFDALAPHDVLPVALVDSVELNPPRWGLLELQDPETARRRMMFMRPALRQKWIDAESKRRERLLRLATRRVRLPIFVEDRFDPRSLSLRLMAA